MKVLIVVVFIAIYAAMIYYFVALHKTAQKRMGEGIEKHDVFYQRFVYHVDLTEQEIIAKLRVPNIYDTRQYELGEDLTTITISELGQCIFHLEPQDSGCLLFVQIIKRISGRHNQPKYDIMNQFWIDKLQAEPIDYDTWLRSRRAAEDSQTIWKEQSK